MIQPDHDDDRSTQKEMSRSVHVDAHHDLVRSCAVHVQGSHGSFGLCIESKNCHDLCEFIY